MRVLFTAYAEKTHFLGMVPLAWALRNAGHEVRVASQPELTGVITGAGLTAVPVGRDHILHRLVGMTKEQAPSAPQPPSYDLAEDRPEVLTWKYLKEGYGAQFVPWWARVVNDPMIGELTEFCRHWKPDLVIWEPVTYAGAIAAKACGAAHARMLWSLDLFTRMRGHYLRARAEHAPHERDAMAEWLGARAAKAGTTFSEEMTTGHFTIDPTPASLRLDLPHTYLPLRYIPYNGVAVVPSWLHTPPAKPRVCLTLGTSATERLDGYSVSVQDVLTSLADLDVEIVATLPEKQQAELHHVPDNTRLVSFVPLHALAPTCSAVISHGGSGTFLTMAGQGVPQLIEPFMFDDELRAERLAGQGAGLVMHGRDASGPRVREHLLRLLEEPSFAESAGRLRAEIEAMPTPNELVPQLERLTAEHRGTTAR
ncbi:activator-dependent family glycosyltransferase [Streptosporangium sp. NPDC002721]|uniref:activator-dependent family glycosyltransferase n=1 Tax=Streptosporangium sp. NPDC002721 TaxID=3366188 RepID=UPI0036C37336